MPNGQERYVIIQLSKLLGNYNSNRSLMHVSAIIQLSKLLGNYNLLLSPFLS